MDFKEREREIVRLREKEHWTFQAIGTQFGISYKRVSQIYHLVQRKRREEKRRLLWRAENQIELLFPLTRGEGIVLEKILAAVLAGELDRPLGIENHGSDPDYLFAAELRRRLVELLLG